MLPKAIFTIPLKLTCFFFQPAPVTRGDDFVIIEERTTTISTTTEESIPPRTRPPPPPPPMGDDREIYETAQDDAISKIKLLFKPGLFAGKCDILL